MNIFEIATRKKLRFVSQRGILSIEDLWDLPLQSKNMVDLDSIARHVNRELKSLGEESFIGNTKTNQQYLLELSLDILKHIIAVKIKERDTAAALKDRAAERNRLLEILERKENQELEGMSKEDILKRLEAL